MNDAISRSAVLEALEAEKGRLMAQKDAGWPFTTEVLTRAVDTVHEFIKGLPALNVAPVVRCKDCRYAFQNNGHEKEGCPIMDRRVWMNGNSFCSEGARMDEEDNDGHQTD